MLEQPGQRNRSSAAGIKIKPQTSKIDIENLLEVFLDRWKTDERRWLWGEVAERNFYCSLRDKLQRKLLEIIAESQHIAEKVKLLKEIISFLDEKQSSKLDFYKQDKESMNISKKETGFLRVNSVS
ncbi:MAG: hypothetical protein R2764_12065 [Bacteroidales bacterium]